MSDHDYIDEELSLWLQNSLISSSLPIDTSHDHDLSSVKVHSSFPKVNEGEVSCSKDVVKTNQECEILKKRRLNEAHNRNEKIRRQKIKEKVYTLKTLIPNCNKGDIASILDDAAKHIISLRYKLQEHQMMSMGRGFPTFQSPLMTQPGQQGMQIPRLGSLGDGSGMGTGTSAMFPSYNFPTSQLGLPAATHPIQYPGIVLESLPSAYMDFEA